LDVERRAAEFFAADDAFYFASGYAGLGILVQTLEGGFDAVFVDELSHYCVFEAAQSGHRPIHLFRHCDAPDLGVNLAANLSPGQRPLVLSDGVFAARGTIAPLAAYRAVLGNYPGAMLCIDDAHAVGVLGNNGRGTIEHAGLLNDLAWSWETVWDCLHARFDGGAPVEPPCPALLCCGTLSKAIGGFGGIIAGSRGFIERLKAASHYYRGASAPPVPAAAATARALELVMADPGLRTRLRANVHTLKDGLRKLGLAADDTPVPIVCLTLGSADNMRRIQAELLQRGIAIAHMAAYAGLGPEGALRLAVFATHTAEMIEQLLDELRRIV
jgi:7-keto-8-aminopelargonate synthetase-like enzyme